MNAVVKDYSLPGAEPHPRERGSGEKRKAAFLCADPSNIERVYGEERIRELKTLADFLPEIMTPESIEKTDMSGIEFLFSTWGMFSLSDAQLERMKSLKALFYAAGATDAFCRPLLKHGISVISAWRANALPVAEFTVAQIILSLKDYFRLSICSPEGWRSQKAGCGAYGERVALLGAGAISSRVQELLKEYDLEVIVIPSHPEKRTVSLEEAFRTAKVISNHFPDRDDNAGVLNARLFSSMRDHAVFINTGRGRQVNESELCDVLERRPDLTALLDVTWPEPPLPGSRLYTLPNVRLSPHIAGSLNDELRRMADFVISDFKRVLAGESPLHRVEESMLLTASGS